VPGNGEWTEDVPQDASDKEAAEETVDQSPEQPGAGETAQAAGQKVSGGEAAPETAEDTAEETARKAPGQGTAPQEAVQDGSCGNMASGKPAHGEEALAEPADSQGAGQEAEALRTEVPGPADGKAAAEEALKKVFEEGKIAGLQEAILAIMEKNGPVTDQMRRDVTENVYHDSLIAWVKSFR